MSAVPKPRLQGQRVWTTAQREEQSRQLKSRQIWLKSTGPKTITGKATSSKNARHADYERREAVKAELRHINTYLRTQKSYSDLLSFFCKQRDNLSPHRYYATAYQLFFLENELIDIERQMFDGMTFYEVAGLNSRLKKKNIIPFAPRPSPS